MIANHTEGQMSSGAIASTPHSFLAVIPARSGSKRIPGKNVRLFAGVPLVARTIQMLSESALFERIVVSTDSAEIAHLTLQHGASPLMRPAHLADDHATTASVVRHVVTELAQSSGTWTSICCVYPSAILLTPDDLLLSSDAAVSQSDPTSVVAAVVKYGHPIQRALVREEAGTLVPQTPDVIERRTQDLDPAWHDAGQFYWASPERWLSHEPLLRRVIPFEMESWRVQDIDTESDWRRAELAYRIISQGASGAGP